MNIPVNNSVDVRRIGYKPGDVVIAVSVRSGHLNHLEKAIGIGRQTLLTIKQNLFWAFAYNIVAIPIAAVGLLNPMWGALFMAFSDIVVIGNSIRLKSKRID